jgi:hypothetical protein
LNKGNAKAHNANSMSANRNRAGWKDKSSRVCNANVPNQHSDHQKTQRPAATLAEAQTIVVVQAVQGDNKEGVF